MDSQIIYVESCPICGDGLCRIRICVLNQRISGMVLCDECDAMWTDPSMKQRVLNTCADSDPSCPSCGLSVWDEKMHWANVGEVCMLGWFDQVHIVDR